MQNLKRKDTNEVAKQKESDLENGCQEEGLQEGTVKEFGVNMCTLLYVKLITNKCLLYSTWNSAQCYVAARMGGEFGR